MSSLDALQQQLQDRDRLIQQLAQEIVQVNQHNRSLQQTLDQSSSSRGSVDPAPELDRQVQRLREELTLKEKEIFALQERMQQVQQENHKLQQYLRDVPELYKRKFSERLAPFKERMNQVESENLRLHQFIEDLDRQLPEDLPKKTPLLADPEQDLESR